MTQPPFVASAIILGCWFAISVADIPYILRGLFLDGHHFFSTD